MLLTRILILFVLLVIFVQDIKSRSVYWILFPLLIVLFIVSDLVSRKSIGDLWRSVLLNLGFLVVQLLIITGWFSLREKRWLISRRTYRLLVEKLKFTGNFFSLLKLSNSLNLFEGIGQIRSQAFTRINLRDKDREEKQLVLEIYLEVAK